MVMGAGRPTVREAGGSCNSWDRNARQDHRFGSLQLYIANFADPLLVERGISADYSRKFLNYKERQCAAV
jgi:hypothetical protein